MEDNNWSRLYTGSDIQVSLLETVLKNEGIISLLKKQTLSVVYGGMGTANSTQLFVENDNFERAMVIAKAYINKESTEQ